MKISYYPGCTLKTKAKNLEQGAIASMAALGVEFEELSRWNCCGAVHSLADDDLIHHVAPVRDLVRAMDQGAEKVVTLCSMCYNTLYRSNELMKNDPVKRKTINDFMNEETPYSGQVEVLHFLTFLKEVVGWEKIRAAVKNPLNGMKVATYYGCTLVRPKDVSIDVEGEKRIMNEFLEVLGATPIDFADANACCGSYQILANEEAALSAAAGILDGAVKAGAEAMALSCPLCEFNLGKRQEDLLAQSKISKDIPVYYFTQLLALALGLGDEAYRFDLNGKNSIEFLKAKNFPVAAAI
ncbi:MAG: CoB--CoM heterodisulfide reductase iron-sulfur subunit B family protein [Acidobacteriota bacterium]